MESEKLARSRRRLEAITRLLDADETEKEMGFVA